MPYDQTVFSGVFSERAAYLYFRNPAEGAGSLQAKGYSSMKKIVQFFKDSYSELKKVVWPSRDDVVASTKVVLVSTFIFAVVLGCVDFLVVWGIDLLF